MVSKSSRIQIIQQIDAIIDGECRGCTIKARIIANCPKGVKPETSVTQYCTKQCPAGLQLQALGKQLGDADRQIPDDQITYRRKQAPPLAVEVYL